MNVNHDNRDVEFILFKRELEALYAAGTLLWMHILKQIPLSIAYPISMGSTIALTFLASHLIFGESYSASQAFGTELIITGVIAMSR
jgi:multidrug transporter EmrE-like cation transporter